METIFMNTENNKTSEPHSKLDLTGKLNLKDTKKNMTLTIWVFITHGKI